MWIAPISSAAFGRTAPRAASGKETIELVGLSEVHPAFHDLAIPNAEDVHAPVLNRALRSMRPVGDPLECGGIVRYHFVEFLLQSSTALLNEPRTPLRNFVEPPILTGQGSATGNMPYNLGVEGRTGGLYVTAHERTECVPDQGFVRMSQDRSLGGRPRQRK